VLNLKSSYILTLTLTRYKYLLRGILKTRIKRGLSWSLTGSGHICR